MLTIRSHGEAATRGYADRLARILRPGDVIALNGPLGAGKTRFVQGLATALGCEHEFVASPTFVLVHEYVGRLPLYHVDAYRLRDADEFRELGGDELANSGGVLCVEWADRIAEALPGDSLRIDFRVLGPAERLLELSATSGRGQAILQLLGDPSRAD